MRKLDGHVVNPANDKIEITVTDDPGAGGANHRYDVSIRDGNTKTGLVCLNFQNGPINEVGVNGVTHEVLLEIVADRLRSFQAGNFACKENDMALTKIEEAQMWLQSRTIKRMRRGVEGTNKV